MVVLAVVIANKKGQVLVSRQFVEITRSRVEGLVNMLPRLMSKSNVTSQHTYIETEDVRYLYHPMENLYLAILTTKESNIIEDLETLKLFARIVPEYCKSLSEKGVYESAFDLIFAFDEVISFGHKEDVTMLQVKTITEMDSHDERVFLAMRQTQERDAKEKMKEKARELEMQRRLQMKMGIKYSPATTYSNPIITDMPSQPEILLSSRQFSSVRYSERNNSPPPPQERGRTLKLSRSKGPHGFIQPIAKKEIVEESQPAPSKHAPVHFRIEEKVSIEMSQERGLQTMDVTGLLYLRLADNITRIQARIEHESRTPIQLQTHPHLDKNLFKNDNMLAMKQPERQFPVNNDVYLLKWHLLTQAESEMPLSLTCWPNKTPRGIEMTIEYQLNKPDLTLSDFWLAVPLGNSGKTDVTLCDAGEYSLNRRSPDGRNGLFLVWKVPIIEKGDSEHGVLEFLVETMSSKGCFPISVGFSGSQSLCGIRVDEVVDLDNSSSSPEFSCETILTCAKFQIN